MYPMDKQMSGGSFMMVDFKQESQKHNISTACLKQVLLVPRPI